jgi:Protein of unknown function (DUF4012)
VPDPSSKSHLPRPKLNLDNSRQGLLSFIQDNKLKADNGDDLDDRLKMIDDRDSDNKPLRGVQATPVEYFDNNGGGILKRVQDDRVGVEDDNVFGFQDYKVEKVTDESRGIFRFAHDDKLSHQNDKLLVQDNRFSSQNYDNEEVAVWNDELNGGYGDLDDEGDWVLAQTQNGYGSSGSKLDQDLIKSVEGRFLTVVYWFQLQLKLVYFEVRLWIRKRFRLFLLLILVLTVTIFGLGISARQSILNVEQNKSVLLERLKTILTQNDKEQLSTLNDLEAKLLDSIGPIGAWPVVGWVVRNDVNKIKNLSALWLDLIYPFANYKLGTDGFRTILLQERYFTQDLESFLNKSPEFISRTRSDLSSLWLYSTFGPSQVREIFGLLNSFLDIIEILQRNQESVLTIFGHLQTQKIVLFNQNTGEARPGGGFLGSYIPIEMAKGEMTIGQSQSIYFFDKGVNTNLMAHPASWYYAHFEGRYEMQGARNANFFPCFPTTANYLQREFAATQNGYNIDTMIMLTPQFLLGYLPDNFVLDIKGEKIPKNFILAKIEQITALEVVDIKNPKKELTSIFNLIVNQLPQVLKGQALANLLTYTQESLMARDLQIWFRSQSIESLWSTTGFAGDQTCAWRNAQAITPLIANISTDKRNLITVNEFQLSKNGSKLTMDYTQFIPSEAATILARGFNRTGFSMVGIQVPAGSDVTMTSDQKLLLPFLRDYYTLYIKAENGQDKKLVYPEEVQKVIDSSYDLNLDRESGFTYTQPDGSQVFGMYVADQNVTKVRFEVQLPSTQSVIFFGQPGLNLPLVRYQGNNFANQRQVQSGLRLK